MALLLLLAGAAVGSFLNVVIYRLPRGESLVRPRSRCLSCGHPLGVLDLFPVLSYLWSRGRCRYCGRSFSPRYMAVELIMGLACVGAWYVFVEWHLGSVWPGRWAEIGPQLQAALVFLGTCGLIVVFFIDLDHYIIPDEAVIVIACAGLALDGLRLLTVGGAEMVVFNEPASMSGVYH
ncbi:MAG: prepilin peptidase, partial [Armatimonadetes bacterium]|nr:prepilin peptidase [Armatimonadota bacterium]